MKQTIKTSRTAGYLEKIFRALNEHYFSGVIEEPVITIQSTPRAYGHVTVAKAWQRADGGQRHELNIGAGTLDRPIENVTATVLHEMVHLYNLQTGVQDTSRGGAYHNKKFRDAAEARDLHISYAGRGRTGSKRGRHPSGYGQDFQHTEGCLPLLWAERPGYQKGQHYLRGLLGPYGGGLNV